jgi:glycosyltransferase involved in cell wall biosynthesis
VPESAPRIAGLVSIVTPCLNGAPFLAKTIESVLAQTYSSVEYIIVDGGSSDGSVTIAGTFGPRIRTIKLPRSSQAEAANAGFRASRGEFFVLLGGDDVLEPTAIELLVAALRAAPGTPFAYADARFIGAADEDFGSYPTRDFNLAALAQACFICQPATLIRAEAIEGVGGFDERYDAAFDYDLWIRFGLDYPNPTRVPSQIAATRMHRATKTFRTPRQNLREIRAIVRRHFGYVPFSWVHAYAGVAISTCDTFFNPPRGSPQRTLLTLLIGLADNRRQPLRFLREFRSEVSRLRHEKRASRIR